MISVSERFKKLCKGDSDECAPYLEIIFPENPEIETITGQNIEQDSMKIEESIWDGDEFRMGGCQASQFEVTLVETESAPDMGITARTFGNWLSGKVIEVLYGFKDTQGDKVESISLFHGTIQNAERQDNRSYRQVVAYDDFYAKFQKDMSDAYNGAFPVADNFKGDWAESPEFTYETGDIVFDTSNNQYYQFNFGQIAADSTITSVYTYIRRFIINKYSPSSLASDSGITIDGETKTSINLAISHDWGDKVYTIVFNHLISPLGSDFSFYGVLQDFNLFRLAVQTAGFTGTYSTDYATWLGKTMVASNFTCADCMRQIYELWGVVGYLDRQGNLKYRKLNNQRVCETIETFENLTYKDHIIIPVDQVSIKDQSGNTYTRPTDEKDYLNPYYVSDNFCFYSPYYSQDATPANISYRMYNGVQGITYRPLEVNTYGMPWIEAGDLIKVITEDGEELTTIVQKRTLSGTSSLRDIFSTNGDSATFEADSTSATQSSQSENNIRQEVSTTNEAISTHENDQYTHINVVQITENVNGHAYRVGPDAGSMNGAGSFVAGGDNHEITGENSVVLGGRHNVVKAERAFATGCNNTLEDTAEESFVSGGDNTVSGEHSHIEGKSNTAKGGYIHIEGQNNSTGSTSHHEHVEGQSNMLTSSGGINHVEGRGNSLSKASLSHMENENNKVEGGTASHVEGYSNTLDGNQSHVEGYNNTVAAHQSHVEGMNQVLSGTASHIENASNEGAGNYIHIEGYQNKSTVDCQHVQGKYNEPDTQNKYAHIVGGGTSDTNRKNIHTLDWEGNAAFAGDVNTGRFSVNDLGNRTVINEVNINSAKDLAQAAMERASGTSIEVDESLSTESENPVQNKVVTTEINELKKSVSDGKSTLASAITSIGVSTEADAAFDVMAENIWGAGEKNYKQGVEQGENNVIGIVRSNGTATESDVLKGKIFSSYVGINVVGTYEPTITDIVNSEKNTLKVLANCPYSCTRSTAVYYRGSVYIHGAAVTSEVATSMYKYDIIQNTWKKLASSPVQHHWSNTAVLVGDEIFYFGNWSGSSILLYKYSIHKNKWINLGVSIPIAAQGAAAVFLGGDIYLFGSNYTNYKKHLYKYSIKNNTFTKLSESLRYDLGADFTPVILGNDLIFFGVKETSYSSGYAAVINPITRITDDGNYSGGNVVECPGKVYGPALAIDSEKVYLLSVGYTNKCYIYNINGDTFIPFYIDSHLPNYASGIAENGEILYFGSATNGQDKRVSVLHTAQNLSALY